MPAITGTWDSQTGVWGESTGGLLKRLPIMSNAALFYAGDYGLTQAGAGVLVALERTGLAVTGRNFRGELKSDPSMVKKVTEIWPLITGTAGDVVKVYAGGHDSPEGAVRWEGPKNFTIGTSTFADFDQTEGPYIGIRFESQGMSPWQLLGYEILIENVGRYV